MFGGLNKKTVLQVLVIFLVLKVLSEGTSGILILLFTLPGVLLAITFHEWAHAFVAVKLGDETPKEQGRVTLNPIKHIDPFGFIFLILAGFGWGKPVEIDSRNFNGKYSISKAEAIVAIAGPIANFILAFTLLTLSFLKVISSFSSYFSPSSSCVFVATNLLPQPVKAINISPISTATNKIFNVLFIF